MLEPVIVNDPVPDPGAYQKLLNVEPPPAKVLALEELFVNLIVEVPAEYVAVLLNTVPVPDNVIVYELPANVPAEIVRAPPASIAAPRVFVPVPEEVKL